MSFSPAPQAPAVEVRGLSLTRGENVLFEKLDLQLRAGDILLLRGPNGAGKTSLLLALAGVLRPAGGEIRLDLGQGEERAETRLHLVGYQSGIKARLSVAENLRFWAALLGGTGEVAAALADVGLAHLAELPAGYLSSGQGKRLSLARLLVAERPLWLLDEPTAALDAEGDALVGRLLDQHRDRGGLAIVATHQPLPLSGSGVSTLTLGAP